MNAIYDFSILTGGIHERLSGLMSPTAVMITEMVIIGTLLIVFVALMGLVLVLAERKVAAFFQLRLGPNRVGPWGSLQTLADFLKLLTKELITTKSADKFLYNLAPFIVMLTPFLALGVIPFAPGLQIMDMNIGVFFITAVSSMGVLGILIGGWASNNKYSLIGGMRSAAMVVSYELSVTLAIMTMVIMTESLSLSEIIASQSDGWWIIKGHIPALIAFLLYLTASTAETNRGPFDLAEAESELTAGFHTEYGGIKFAFFFLSEFVNMLVVASIATILFFGGWMPFHLPFEWAVGFNHIMDFIPGIVWGFGKVTFVIFLMMWFRWTFPRLRIDQILNLEWKYLLPMNLVNFLLMALIALSGFYL
jgi:NADH-quinone oxidoreductase subunit H